MKNCSGARIRLTSFFVFAMNMLFVCFGLCVSVLAWHEIYFAVFREQREVRRLCVCVCVLNATCSLRFRSLTLRFALSWCQLMVFEQQPFLFFIVRTQTRKLKYQSEVFVIRTVEKKKKKLNREIKLKPTPRPSQSLYRNCRTN